MENRSTTVGIRYTETEKNKVKEIADQMGLSLSQFIREVTLKNNHDNMAENILYIRESLDDLKEYVIKEG